MNTGSTPLMVAAFHGHVGEVRKRMAARVGSGVQMEEVYGALVIATLKGHVRVVQELSGINGVDCGTQMEDGVAPLHIASREGHLDMVQLLLGAGVNCEARRTDGVTPLHIASSEGHLDVVRELLGAGARHDVINETGATPLCDAVLGGHAHVVQELLIAGAHPREVSRYNDYFLLLQTTDDSGPLAPAPVCGVYQCESSEDADEEHTNVVYTARKRIENMMIRAPALRSNTWEWPIDPHPRSLAIRKVKKNYPLDIALGGTHAKTVTSMTKYVDKC